MIPAAAGYLAIGSRQKGEPLLRVTLTQCAYSSQLPGAHRSDQSRRQADAGVDPHSVRNNSIVVAAREMLKDSRIVGLELRERLDLDHAGRPLADIAIGPGDGPRGMLYEVRQVGAHSPPRAIDVPMIAQSVYRDEIGGGAEVQ